MRRRPGYGDIKDAACKAAIVPRTHLETILMSLVPYVPGVSYVPYIPYVPLDLQAIIRSHTPRTPYDAHANLRISLSSLTRSKFQLLPVTYTLRPKRQGSAFEGNETTQLWQPYRLHFLYNPTQGVAS
jgi:hypothetical protein